MIIIPKRKVWTRQPQSVTRSTRSPNSVLVNVAARADVINGNPLIRYASADGNLLLAPDTYGKSIRNSNVSQSYSVPMATIGTSPLTLVALLGGVSQSVVNYADACGVFNGSTGFGIATIHNYISYRWGIYQGSTGAALLDSGEAWPTTGLHLVVYTRAASGVRLLYRNGVLKATDTASLPNTPAAPFRIGSLYDGGANQFGSQVPVYYAGIFLGEVWDEPEIRKLSINPFAIFKSQTHNIFLPDDAGGGTTTITCTIGNAVAEGTAAKANLSLVTTPANAVAEGIQVSLDGSIRVIADPANAVGSGTTANVSLTITTNTGSAVAEGITASLSTTVTVTCTPADAAAEGIASHLNKSVNCVTTSATAEGITASLAGNVTITTTTGNSVADGLSANVVTMVTLVTTPANAVAGGVSSTVAVPSYITCSVGNSVAAGIVCLVTVNATVGVEVVNLMSALTKRVSLRSAL